MKIKTILRIACIGAAAYALYEYMKLDQEDYSRIEDFQSIDLSTDKTSFRDKLEEDLAAAENKYQ